MAYSRKTIRKPKQQKEYRKTSSGKTWMNGQTNKENAIAYCHNPSHIGYMNASLIKQHDCLGKNCKYLSKYEDKDYWITKSVKNALKKLNKNNGIGYIYINNEVHFTDNLEKLCNICKKELNKSGKAPKVEYKLKLEIREI